MALVELGSEKINNACLIAGLNQRNDSVFYNWLSSLSGKNKQLNLQTAWIQMKQTIMSCLKSSSKSTPILGACFRNCQQLVSAALF
ncbi:MAG: hypothetical protein AB2693_21185 [Candidatus Thiodiazotropha sp.]